MYCCYYSINVFIRNDGCSYVFWVVKKNQYANARLLFTTNLLHQLLTTLHKARNRLF